MSLQPPERRLVTEATLGDYIGENPDVIAQAGAAAADAVVDRSLVQASNVRRIIASTDPDEPLIDGDLLLVYEPPPPPPTTFFTDFSDATTGQMPPGWETAWVAGTWQAATATGSTGGKVLRSTSTTNTRKAVRWSGIESDTGMVVDAEAVMRFTAPVANSDADGPAIILRGNGGASTERGIIAACRGDNRIIVRAYVDGTNHSVVLQAPYTWTVGDWYWMRFRAVGYALQVRVWADGEAEPSTWQIDGTGTSGNTTVTPGWVGLFNFRNKDADVDLFGYSVDGTPAPKVPA